MSTYMLLLSSSFRNASNQVVNASVNATAATPSTFEIVGTLSLVGILILILIYIAWLNISYAIRRAQLDVLTIHDVIFTFCMLLLIVPVLFIGVNIMCFYLSLL